GQIFLQSDLFNSGQRPAIDVGRSVSRVGGAAQTKALKKVSGTLKISLARYRDLQGFAMFSSDLDPATKGELTRGSRLMELLKQPQFHPVAMERQVVQVWCGTHGKYDELDLVDVLPFANQLCDWLEDETGILGQIRSTKDFSKETEAQLEKAVEEFKGRFITHTGQPLAKEAGPVGEVDQEKMVVGQA
ncbi:MAG: F0F1 ATP synthase subunit alpha, partial [Aeriscardovia sp.]|nr:F0F1 ATP synthase subunit alpha [Aeriscardovia sp.]